MNNISIDHLFSVVLVVFMLMSIIWLIISIVVLMKLYGRYTKNSLQMIELQSHNKDKLIDYSTELMDFIRMLISQVALLKVKEFTDGNDITKVTRAHIEGIISDVATEIKEQINMNNISLANTIYTEEFFDQYIVDSTVYIVKELFEKSVSKSLDLTEENN